MPCETKANKEHQVVLMLPPLVRIHHALISCEIIDAFSLAQLFPSLVSICFDGFSTTAVTQISKPQSQLSNLTNAPKLSYWQTTH